MKRNCTLKYDIAYTTMDGESLTSEASTYGCYDSKRGLVLSWVDGSGQRRHALVRDYEGHIKPEHRQRASYKRGKKNVLLSLEPGASVRVRDWGETDRLSWRTIFHYYGRETGRRWHYVRVAETQELVILRTV